MIPAIYLQSLLGGALIGLSAALLLILNGRIAGVSGIAAGVFGRVNGEAATRFAFLAGLVAGPAAYRLAFGAWPPIHVSGSIPLLIGAGLLVGFGTRLGSGCTSGHGVCGLARLSRRSMVAVATFLVVAVLTVTIQRHGGGL